MCAGAGRSRRSSGPEASDVRMIECNICGEPLAAATDDELVRRLIDHIESEHPDSSWDEEALRQTVAEEAYDASDS